MPRPIFILICLLYATFSLRAVEPGDVIINEVYFNPKDGGSNHSEAVEILVIKNGVNLNGLQFSDRDFWDRQTEDQCTVQDLGQGFLDSVRSGTLLVLYREKGEDDTDASDFVLRFYAKSSLFCNTAPTTNAFQFSNFEDNLHLLHLGKQVDFIKYHTSNRPKLGPSNPGALPWEKGPEGYIDAGISQQNTGVRFLGDKPELNDFPAAWQTYPETYLESNNLGEPNGGRNTVWIEKLRNKPLSSKVESSGNSE